MNIGKGSLLERTQALLHDRPRHMSYADIAAATGLSRAFVRTIGERRIADPSVNGVQRIYEYLTGTKLAVK